MGCAFFTEEKERSAERPGAGGGAEARGVMGARCPAGCRLRVCVRAGRQGPVIRRQHLRDESTGSAGTCVPFETALWLPRGGFLAVEQAGRGAARAACGGAGRGGRGGGGARDWRTAHGGGHAYGDLQSTCRAFLVYSVRRVLTLVFSYSPSSTLTSTLRQRFSFICDVATRRPLRSAARSSRRAALFSTGTSALRARRMTWGDRLACPISALAACTSTAPAGRVGGGASTVGHRSYRRA